ncbi:MAG: cation transporter, partial [Aeromicrobium sp.]
LVGMEVAPSIRDYVMDRIAGMAGVSSVGYLHVEFVGPRRVFIVASVDLVGDENESTVADRLRSLEHQLETEDEVVEAVLTVSRPGHPPDSDLPDAVPVD